MLTGGRHESQGASPGERAGVRSLGPWPQSTCPQHGGHSPLTGAGAHVRVAHTHSLENRAHTVTVL